MERLPIKHRQRHWMAVLPLLILVVSVVGIKPVICHNNNWLHTDGMFIKDAAGNVVTLRGVHIYTCLQNEQVKFTRSKEMGANVVRLAIWKNAVEGNLSGPCVGTPGLENIDRAIAYAKNAGLMVILDQHIWSLNVEPAPTAFFTDAALQESWLTMWRTLIDRYANEPTVIGVDLMNEPWSIVNRPANAKALWEGIAKNAVTVLRPRNPNLIFFVSGWGPVTFPMWDDIAFLRQPNTAITDHVYGEKTVEWLNTRYSTYQGIPVWLGEIGFTTISYMEQQLDRFDALGLHYTLFVYGVNSWGLLYDIVDRNYNLTVVGLAYRDHLASLTPPLTDTPTSTNTPTPTPTFTPTPTPTPECITVRFHDGSEITVCEGQTCR